MHEQGIAKGLVKRAVAEAVGRGSSKVAGLNILLGPMGFVAKDALVLAVEWESMGTRIEGVEIRVTETAKGGIVLESIELEELS